MDLATGEIWRNKSMRIYGAAQIAINDFAVPLVQQPVDPNNRILSAAPTPISHGALRQALGKIDDRLVQL